MDDAALTTTSRSFCLAIAGLTAWLLSMAADLVPPFIAGWFDMSASFPTFEQMLWIIGVYAVVGLPVAMAISFTLGGRALDHAVGTGQTRLVDAARAGAWIGASVGVVSLTFTFLMGVNYQLDNNSSFNSYTHGVQIVSDGMPTVLGWGIEFGGFIVTICIGAAAAMLTWLVLKTAAKSPM